MSCASGHFTLPPRGAPARLRIDEHDDRAIGDAIFQITGKRFCDLPFSKHDLTWS